MKKHREDNVQRDISFPFPKMREENLLLEGKPQNYLSSWPGWSEVDFLQRYKSTMEHIQEKPMSSWLHFSLGSDLVTQKVPYLE